MRSSLILQFESYDCTTSSAYTRMQNLRRLVGSRARALATQAAPPVRIHNAQGTKRVVVTKDLPGTRWLEILTSADCSVEARVFRGLIRRSFCSPARRSAPRPRLFSARAPSRRCWAASATASSGSSPRGGTGSSLAPCAQPAAPRTATTQWATTTSRWPTPRRPAWPWGTRQVRGAACLADRLRRSPLVSLSRRAHGDHRGDGSRADARRCAAHRGGAPTVLLSSL